MEQKKLTLKDFKEGTILWLKVSMVLTILISLSYLSSKVFAFFGLFYFIYLFIFGVIGATFQIVFSLGDKLSVILPFFVLLVYLLIAINYFYLKYSKQQNTVWWLTTLFVIFTILYVIGIFVGLTIFLAWHP